MKDLWSKYALKDGKVKSSYIREYSNRSPKRETRKASGSYSILQGREVQKEIKCPELFQEAWVIDIRPKDESIREENVSEGHQEERHKVEEIDIIIQVGEKEMKGKELRKEKKKEVKEVKEVKETKAKKK